MSRSMSMYPDDMVQDLQKEVHDLQAIRKAAIHVVVEFETDCELTTWMALANLREVVRRHFKNAKDEAANPQGYLLDKSIPYCGEPCDRLSEEKSKKEDALLSLEELRSVVREYCSSVDDFFKSGKLDDKLRECRSYNAMKKLAEYKDADPLLKEQEEIDKEILAEHQRLEEEENEALMANEKETRHRLLRESIVKSVKEALIPTLGMKLPHDEAKKIIIDAVMKKLASFGGLVVDEKLRDGLLDPLVTAMLGTHETVRFIDKEDAPETEGK